MGHLISSRLIYRDTYQTLLPVVREARECQAITQRLLAHYWQLDPVAIVLDTPITCSSNQTKSLSAAIERLRQQEPIQYILGEAPFLGRRFRVTPAILIPRPETEALVQYIIDHHPSPGIHVLDIGTGSGCIAITLKKELCRATVHALEVDPQALRVARANALQLDAVVHFVQADILHESLPDQRWDVIVSNPPYVRLSERTRMRRCVLDYEPTKALFVPDDRPLIFYERIAALAPQHLTPGGVLYLEINEALGLGVVNLLVHAGFHSVSVKQDIHGKDRWVVGRYS